MVEHRPDRAKSSSKLNSAEIHSVRENIGRKYSVFFSLTKPCNTSVINRNIGPRSVPLQSSFRWIRAVKTSD